MTLNDSMFGGIQITKSDLCLEKTSEPKKIHMNLSKMSYHLRIQKKWNKRYGFVMKPLMYKTPYGFLCHPSLYDEIMRKIK